ncbi:MAG: ABC transporter permease [Bryobacteraceae bacterium]|nr:ABC transporter permease [Bryobacteraceae bacterium]
MSRWVQQITTIARLEASKAFFSKRGLWVYLLALFPAVIFFGHGLDIKWKRQSWNDRIVAREKIESVQIGERAVDVKTRLGSPLRDFEYRSRDEDREVSRRFLEYFDGQRRHQLHFENGLLKDKSVRSLASLEEDTQVFAGVFQYFYLRLAIFFGCLGIFMNLFRGEMLDKTLHFWFLAPVRREVLLAGKYGAGLLASAVIFGGGTILTFFAMLSALDPADVQAYWQGPAASHLFWYTASAILGCVGYGSVFLAAGLLLKNPIAPASMILLWESINGFLPVVLQKLSVLYYVQSLCPIPPPTDKDMPAALRLLLAPAEPAPAALAILGLLGVTALVLWVASQAVKRLEVNYSTE